MTYIVQNRCLLMLSMAHKKSSAVFLADYLHCFLLLTLSLFLSEENLNWRTREIKILSQFIFDKAFIRIFNILWQITEESKHRRGAVNLRNILDFDVLSF